MLQIHTEIYVTGSYKNVASASTDANGDTLTVTHLKYDKWTDKNSNGIAIHAGEIDPETSNVADGMEHISHSIWYLWSKHTQTMVVNTDIHLMLRDRVLRQFI